MDILIMKIFITFLLIFIIIMWFLLMDTRKALLKEMDSQTKMVKNLLETIKMATNPLIDKQKNYDDRLRDLEYANGTSLVNLENRLIELEKFTGIARFKPKESEKDK